MGNHVGAAELAKGRSSGVAEWTFGFLASGRSHTLSEKYWGISIDSTSLHDSSLRQVPPATPELLQLLNFRICHSRTPEYELMNEFLG
jgi:hypothetical protein